MKVKVVITEMNDTSVHRLLRRFGSLLNVKCISNLQYGMFHASLIIGPFYLEWGDNSMTIVRQKSSAKAVFAIDVAKIKGLNEVANAIDNISQVCSYWNGNKTYDNTECNCQHFVTTILEQLELRNEFEKNLRGPVLEYMNRLKNQGVCDMRYTLDRDIIQLILESECNDEIKELVQRFPSIKFTNHALLDQLVSVILENYPHFPEDRKYEYMMLKAFDRAFWLQRQSAKKENDESVMPWTLSGKCMCPFSETVDEVVNNSIVGNDFELQSVQVPVPVFQQ